MTLPLQAVHDQATDQNFRQVGERFPIQKADLANGVKEQFLQLSESANRKILHGGISAAGAKVAGSAGWTCEKVSTGLYKINISPALSTPPHVTFSVAGTPSRIPLRVETATTTEVTYFTVDTTFAVGDAATHFMLIG